MDSIKLEIEGMSCAHCVAKVRGALAAVKGVAVTDVQIGTATVEMDPVQANIGTLIDAVQDAGYEARESF
ncbi:MAG TPA: heavy-metal-associated domain-containing protein [Gemmatimonadaceae bacterium]|nr:heavy-metal-associated domain-containing protein [Gemmatimonadaceae bacterium]